MKIKNLKKFVRSVILVFLLILVLSLIITNKTFSHGETKFKYIYISNGDTLWSIAREEKESNKFYEGKDLRDIIDNIKLVNNLKTSELKASQKLIIPVI